MAVLSLLTNQNAQNQCSVNLYWKFSLKNWAPVSYLLLGSNVLHGSPKFRHRQLVVSIPRLSAPSCHLLSKINRCYGNILLYKTSVISIMVNHFDYKYRCLVAKNVPIALILPSTWQDGAESLGIVRTSCLWFH